MFYFDHLHLVDLTQSKKKEVRCTILQNKPSFFHSSLTYMKDYPNLLRRSIKNDSSYRQNEFLNYVGYCVIF